MLACGGWDRKLSIFDLAGGAEPLVISGVIDRYIRALSFSPDGRQIVTGGGGQTRLWDTKMGKEIPTQHKMPDEMCPTFLPNGQEIAAWCYTEGRVSIWAVPAGQLRASWRAHPKVIEGLAVSPDGRFLVSTGQEGIARLWSTVDQSEVANFVGHNGSVYAAAFSPDGKRLATSGFDDFTVRLWDLPQACHVK
jgi:WD40 repeat protein